VKGLLNSASDELQLHKHLEYLWWLGMTNLIQFQSQWGLFKDNNYIIRDIKVLLRM
jgi:hypothetical protein